MKLTTILVVLVLAGCASSPDSRTSAVEESDGCSTSDTDSLRTELATARMALDAAGKVSDSHPTDENNAKTASAAADVATAYAMLEITQSGCTAD